MSEGPTATSEAGRRAAEAVARTSYGRLVALLAYRWRDLGAAEDALGDAFASALEHWPRSGVPTSPEAWLMTAAKRELLQRARHARVEQDPTVRALFDADPVAPETAVVPDDRLKLMFVCAHPAVPEAMRAPLMMQAVLGLDAKTIADAFLVSPRAMAQRLVRAKARIRDTALRFEEPEARDLPERLGQVLEAIYGAYTIGRHRSPADVGGTLSPLPVGLTGEAVYLCRVVVGLMPEQPEPAGLLALMLYCEARRPAQFDALGRFVPLDRQDTSRWQRASIAEAENALRHAARMQAPGLFQIEAAIQSAHCQRAATGETPWRAIAQLYDGLVRHFPSIGAQVGQAVAVAEAGDVARGQALLDAIDAASVTSYQPWWVARAHLLRLEGRMEASRPATLRAVGLTDDPRVRAWLLAAAPGAVGPLGFDPIVQGSAR